MVIYLRKHARAAATFFAYCAAAACASSGGAPGDSEARASACPVSIERAEAWVNRMPGPDAKPTLNVVVTLATAPDIKVSLSETAGGDDALQLDLAPAKTQTNAGPVSLDPGTRVRYAAPTGEDTPTRVVISCAGDIVAIIDDVPSVY